MAIKRTKAVTRPVAKPASRAVSEGKLVEIEKSQEHWNQYDLADGTVLRVKPVVVEVRHIAGSYTPDGDPAYAAKTALIVDVRAPDRLKRKKIKKS